MCEPITIATAALSTAKIGMDFIGGNQEAKAQDQRYAINKENVLESAALNFQSAQLETLQAGEAAGRDKIENSKNALKARASATVAAGESGVTGLSVDALVRDVYGQEATNADAIDQQAEFRDQQQSNELLNIGYTARSQINQVKKGQKPSVFGALLQLGGVGLNAFAGMSGGSSGSSSSAPKGP